MSRQPVGWYLRRMRRMSPTELAWRTRDHALQKVWSRKQVRPGDVGGRPPLAGTPRFTATLPRGAATAVPDEARKAVVATADAILDGELELLGVVRTDLLAPDWFQDPVTGRRSDPARYAFGLNHRNEELVGNVKQVWELSRQHHLTQLAAAYYLTGDERYAVRTADQLQDWWERNPFLSGIHWTSGIEIGLRLISWTWIRRLLDGWPLVTDLFERNELARRQLYWHQRYLAAFRSRGSSANNHVIAEAAGQLAGACAFPWFKHSTKWRNDASALLERELVANTFPSGVNRELATDYHRFVSELGLYAAIEAELAGHPVSPEAWSLLTRTVDVAAAIVDTKLRPPRQGDDDEGQVLVVDPPDPSSWAAFLALGTEVVGRASWWPQAPPTAVAALAGALVRRRTTKRPDRRPEHFADAGLTVLHSRDAGPEIWCRCDAGPHGFLSIAAHAHSDALSIEVRVGGVDVLADPGTYSYHGEADWRNYFRSTIGHNTLEVAGTEQSDAGGPFLWLRGAKGHVLRHSADHESSAWSAVHDGYRAAMPPTTHRRTVDLRHDTAVLRVEDHLDREQPVRLAWHLGPEVTADLVGHTCRLVWPDGAAVIDLPPELSWTAHRGERDPILGWYSARFGQKTPATTLVGAGRLGPDAPLVTIVRLRS